MSNVELIGISKNYGSTVALHQIDMSVREGELLTLLGPSGCGKTTTLRLVAGFLQPSRGTIRFGSEDVTLLPPHRREIGMVFQDYALFPHLTIADNIGFALKERKVPAAAATKRVEELLELIRLPTIAQRYPSELSGGQAQRVAFARAIAHPPRVLLMDEPLGALDLKMRETMQFELRRMQQALGITTIFVTHDQGEAMSMSDRIVVMNHGRIEQIGTAELIYSRPASKFVANFVGQINLMEGTVVAWSSGFASVQSDAGDSIRVRTEQVGAGLRCAAAVRPEKMRIRNGSGPAEAPNTLAGRVSARSFAGSSVRLVVDVGQERSLFVEDKPEALTAVVGDEICVSWAPEDTLLLEA